MKKFLIHENNRDKRGDNEKFNKGYFKVGIVENFEESDSSEITGVQISVSRVE